LPTWKDRPEARAMSLELHVHCPDSSRAVDAIVDNRHPAVGLQRLIAHIIAIENGSRTYSQPFVSHGIETFKKTRFSTKVRFHSLMKINMLMRNIGNDTYIKMTNRESEQTN